MQKDFVKRIEAIQYVSPRVAAMVRVFNRMPDEEAQYFIFCIATRQFNELPPLFDPSTLTDRESRALEWYFNLGPDRSIDERDDVRIVGLYVHPPARALVLLATEKSSIQDFDDVELKSDWSASTKGISSLFSPFLWLERRLDRYSPEQDRDQEIRDFLSSVQLEIPAGGIVRVLVDVSPCKREAGVDLRAAYPEFLIRLTSASSYWPWLIQDFFREAVLNAFIKSRQHVGLTLSLINLKSKIGKCVGSGLVEYVFDDPDPFIWIQNIQPS